MRFFAGAMLAALVLYAGNPSFAQVLTEDDGRCAAGLVATHTAHEWGHDFTAIAVGGSPWRPVVIWGDKWNEAQTNFHTAAIGGFIGQHLFSAFSAATPEDSFSRCAVHGDTVISGYYALRAKLYPDRPGDYDPFSLARRREIMMINIGFSLFLEGFAETVAADERWIRSRSSVFNFNTIFRGN